MKYNIGDVVEYKQKEDSNTIVATIIEIKNNTYTLSLNYITIHSVPEEKIIKKTGHKEFVF